ncbi:MAG: ribonuclease HII [Acidobacteria bacterium]|nr:MAG: ribonuclease HII [Acidobacteriota bacterium]
MNPGIKAGKTGKEQGISPSALKMRLLKRLRCTQRFEKQAWQAGARLVAGVDEVGRGSLFGPVVAAALLAERREVLAERIRERALCFAIAAVDSETIDAINIYQASRLAMLKAVEQLSLKPDHLLIDAMQIEYNCSQTKIIHGDALSVSIAAASIIAKVERDRMMRELHEVYPLYGLASNKGYSTPVHIRSLREHGPSPLHRQSFAPVWNSNKAPQEVLEFMMEEAAEVAELANSEAEPVLTSDA